MRLIIASLLLAACGTQEAGDASLNMASAPDALNAAQDVVMVPEADTLTPSPDANLAADLNKAVEGKLAAAPEVVIIDGRRYRPITGQRLREALFMTRIHDPECPTPDHCDDVFLRDGRYLKSVSPDDARRLGSEWSQGRFQIQEDRYCLILPRTARRCFALMERDDRLAFRIELGAREASPTIVQLLPASRGGFVYP